MRIIFRSAFRVREVLWQYVAPPQSRSLGARVQHWRAAGGRRLKPGAMPQLRAVKKKVQSTTASKAKQELRDNKEKLLLGKVRFF